MNKIIVSTLAICLILAIGLFLIALREPEGVTDEEYAQVWVWLTCEECTDGEWEAVRRIGDRAIPLLKKLNNPLSNGRRANMARRYGALWAGIPRPSTDSATYVDDYISNMESVIQRRAIIALWRLGSWAGLDEVQTAARSGTLPDDVLGEYQRILLANPPSADSGTIVFTGPSGTFTLPSITPCRTAPAATRPAQEGTCFSYSGPRIPPSWFTVLDNGMNRWYSGQLPEGIYEVGGGEVTQTYLLWVVSEMGADTIFF